MILLKKIDRFPEGTNREVSDTNDVLWQGGANKQQKRQ
jgi:hypothetical protein